MVTHCLCSNAQQNRPTSGASGLTWRVSKCSTRPPQAPCMSHGPEIPQREQAKTQYHEPGMTAAGCQRSE